MTKQIKSSEGQQIEAERSLAGQYITYPNSSPEARKKGKVLAGKVRREYQTSADSDETLEGGMSSLRGRA